MASRSLRRRAVAATAAVLTCVLALSACGGDSDDSDNSGGGGGASGSAVKLVTSGKIKTCTNLPYPPFQFDEGGKTVGFDVDMIDLVAKKLGVTQEIVNIDFDVIKSGAAMNANRCDVAAAAMTITDERKQNIGFSRPYFPEVIALLVKKGAGVKTVEELKAKGLSLGVQADTTSLDYAKSKGVDAKQYKNSGLELTALQSGAVDAVVQDLPVVNDWLKKPEISAKFEMAAEIPTGAQYGFGVKKAGSEPLLQVINEVITTAVNDGTWAATYKKWIGSDPKTKPADA